MSTELREALSAVAPRDIAALTRNLARAATVNRTAQPTPAAVIDQLVVQLRLATDTRPDPAPRLCAAIAAATAAGALTQTYRLVVEAATDSPPKLFDAVLDELWLAVSTGDMSPIMRNKIAQLLTVAIANLTDEDRASRTVPGVTMIVESSEWVRFDWSGRPLVWVERLWLSDDSDTTIPAGTLVPPTKDDPGELFE